MLRIGRASSHLELIYMYHERLFLKVIRLVKFRKHFMMRLCVYTSTESIELTGRAQTADYFIPRIVFIAADMAPPTTS